MDRNTSCTIEACGETVTMAVPTTHLPFQVISRHETVTLPDGRTLNKHQLYLEALRCNPTDAVIYCNLASTLSAHATATLCNGRTFKKWQLYLEAVCHSPQHQRARTGFTTSLPAGQAWTRHHHSLVFGSMGVNVLFATLLLGLQRLETDGVLPPAHHSMLEDMLEGWTWGDTQQLA